MSNIADPISIPVKRGPQLTRLQGNSPTRSGSLVRRGSSALTPEGSDEVVLLSTDTLFQEELLDIFGEENNSGAENTPAPHRLQRQPSLILHHGNDSHPEGQHRNESNSDTAPESLPSRVKRNVKKFCEPNWFWIYNLRLAKYVRSFLGRTPQNRIDETRKLAFDFRENIKPGIITAFISFPLVVAVGAAIGVPPSTGIRAALWALLATVMFGGCRFTVFGPTAILTVPLARIADLYGPDVLPFVSIGVGVVVFLSLVLRVQEYMMFIPSTVTHGTSLGVACLIFLYQFKNALGLPGFIVRQSVLEYMYHCFELIPKTNPWSLIMFVVTFTALYLSGRYKPALPHTVIVGVAGVLVGFVLKMSLSEETFVSSIDTIYSRYGDLRTSLFQAPVWKNNFLSLSLIGYIFELSFIVLIESYSSARMTYDHSGLHFSQQHEVLGLAVANLAAGATGGFVVSSGISRAMMNISNGATSRTSGVVHLIVLLLMGVVLTPIVDLMPMPMIAAMQYIGAMRQINYDAFSLYWRTNKHAFAVGIASAFFCVVVAPFVGLLLGIVMSMMLFSYELGKGSVEVTIKRRTHHSASVRHSETPDLPRRATTAARVVTRMRDVFERQAPLIVYRLTGALTFVNAVAHAENLKNMAKPTTNLIINMRYLFSIDFDGTQALAKVMTHLDATLGRPVVLCCVNHFIKEHLECQSWFLEKLSKNLIFKTEAEAVQKIHEIPQRNQPAESEAVQMASPMMDPPSGIQADTSRLSDSSNDPMLSTQILSPMLRRTLEIKVVNDEDSPVLPPDVGSISQSTDDTQMVPLEEITDVSQSSS